MKQSKIWYSVSNGGNGSAYPQFMESEELAEWHQDHLDEGWGESCTGSITVQSERDIFCPDVRTKEQMLVEYFASGRPKDEAFEFVDEFFKSGIPKFEVRYDDSPAVGYSYNWPEIDGTRIMQIFKRNEDSGQVLEDKLNNIGQLYEQWLAQQ